MHKPSSVKVTLFSILAMVFAAKALAQAPVVTSSVAAVESLDLSIRIHPKVFGDLDPAMFLDVSRVICNNFASNLRQGSGPWGMGLFRLSTECSISDQVSSAFAPNLWTLRFGAPEGDFLPLALCRPKNLAADDKQEKCDVNLKIKMNPKHADRMLANAPMARLISAYILDWAPFQSKLTPNLVTLENPKVITLKDESADTTPFAIPKTKHNVVPISVDLEAKTGLFNVKIMKLENLQQLGVEGKTWLANGSGRGEHDVVFQKQLITAVAALAPVFNKHDLDAENPQNIIGRPEREFVKYRLSPQKKNEFELTVNAGGIYTNSSTSTVFSHQYQSEFAFHKSKWINAWVNGSYMSNSYKMNSSLSGADVATETLKNDGSFVASRLTAGFGIRLSLESDHTIAVFPSIGLGMLSWKTLNAVASRFDVVLGDMEEGGFVYGGAVEYQSPERWIVNLRSRIEIQAQPSLTTSKLNNEISMRMPASVDFLVKEARASNAWATAFFEVARHSITGVSKKVSEPQEIQLSIVDAKLGVGLRLNWL